MNNNREFQKIAVKNSEQERFCPVQIKPQVIAVAAAEGAFRVYDFVDVVIVGDFLELGKKCYICNLLGFIYYT